MATWKYEISLLILKNISLVHCTHLLQYVTIATVKRTCYVTFTCRDYHVFKAHLGTCISLC